MELLNLQTLYPIELHVLVDYPNGVFEGADLVPK
jgi:hypothetical protein